MPMGRKLQSYSSDINVTPMVDVMLVLLIIFMVITPMLQHGANVDLAKTKNPVPMEDADKEDAVLIAVTKDGAIYFDTQKVTEAELTTKVGDRLSNRADKKIYIKADGRAQYGTVVQVVDDVRAAGVDQVGLLTEQISQQNQKPPVPPR
jgi:biopolymer transport protein ExbD